MNAIPNVVVKPSRQFPFLARHPWVHVQSLTEATSNLALGDEVDLVQHDGTWLARGLYNPASRLRVRLYSWQRGESLDAGFFHRRIDQAIRRRILAGIVDEAAIRWDDSSPSATAESHSGPDLSAARLVFSESDGLSGLIVDKYADYLVVQIAAGVIAERLELVLDHLQRRLRPTGIFVRTDDKTAKKEGIEPIVGLCRGAEPEKAIVYQQNELRWQVDLQQGQKTGAYLDQRDNHAAAARYLQGRDVLDVCCYTGGFGIVAAHRGAASVVGVDSSERALEAARANQQANAITNIEFVKAECFDFLAAAQPQHEGREATSDDNAIKAFTDRRFDAVVLDPPRFAGSRKQVASALRAYAKLNRLAIDLLPPEGILVTCSCSGSVGRSDFLNMLVDVGRRAKRDLVIMESRSASADHAMRVSCPETDYLKCFICQVL
ncbi:MAG: class I SAM-dependent rRNA methyltransferase [Pirellulaceae bacterium]